MVNFELTPEQLEIQKTARDFAEKEIKPVADIVTWKLLINGEGNRGVVPANLDALSQLGYFVYLEDIKTGELYGMEEGREINVSEGEYQIIASKESIGTDQLPANYFLAANRPNPFNPTTVIQLGLPKDTYVRLTVYNILGQEVMELANGDYPAGIHDFIWNGKDENGQSVSSGIYLYHVKTDQFAQTRKMILMK